MRRIVVSSIAALAAMGFAAAAQAEGDGGCGWSKNTVAATPIPAVTSTKAATQTAIPTKKTVAQTAKTIKTEKGS